MVLAARSVPENTRHFRINVMGALTTFFTEYKYIWTGIHSLTVLVFKIVLGGLEILPLCQMAI